MIQTHDLTKKFGQFTAVDKLNLNITRGEIFGFLGANGAGKTTTIRMLCGLIPPSSGTASLAGFDILRQSENVKASLGYMSQRFALYDDLKLSENIIFYGGIYHLAPRTALANASRLLDDLGLKASLSSYVRDIPMGYKQRLALICSLVHDPPVLVLDEPTSGVDPKARREFWELINDLSRAGKTILVSTHFMDEAEYCHRVIIMRDGKDIAQGVPAELKAAYGVATMQDLFLRLARGDGA
ncbi:MAG TPA: ABC transporter ATP-binding protein [Candidatus Cloacimonadota bacterium]|nr:ABC transporter ATP-binding protein [Candidatus Cloacimonadota bacterium]